MASAPRVFDPHAMTVPSDLIAKVRHRTQAGDSPVVADAPLPETQSKARDKAGACRLLALTEN